MGDNPVFFSLEHLNTLTFGGTHTLRLPFWPRHEHLCFGLKEGWGVTLNVANVGRGSAEKEVALNIANVSGQ